MHTINHNIGSHSVHLPWGSLADSVDGTLDCSFCWLLVMKLSYSKRTQTVRARHIVTPNALELIDIFYNSPEDESRSFRIWYVAVFVKVYFVSSPQYTGETNDTEFNLQRMGRKFHYIAKLNRRRCAAGDRR